MADKDATLKLTAQDVAHSFTDPVWAGKFPPVLSVNQVAELLQVPKQTVYDWHSRGLLRGCCRRIGKYLPLIARDSFYLFSTED